MYLFKMCMKSPLDVMKLNMCDISFLGLFVENYNMSKNGGEMIGNNPSTNGEEIPLNSSKVMRKDVVVIDTKVRGNNKETSGIPVPKPKTTTGV